MSLSRPHGRRPRPRATAASGALRPASRPSERTGTLGPPSPQTRSRCVRPPRGAWLPGGAEPPGWRGPRQCARPGRAPHTPLAPRPGASHTRLCPGRVCDAAPHSGRRDPEGKAARAPRLAPRGNRVQEGDIWKARGRGTRLHRESWRPDPASSHGPGVRRRSVRRGPRQQERAQQDVPGRAALGGGPDLSHSGPPSGFARGCHCVLGHLHPSRFLNFGRVRSAHSPPQIGDQLRGGLVPRRPRQGRHGPHAVGGRRARCPPLRIRRIAAGKLALRSRFWDERIAVCGRRAPGGRDPAGTTRPHEPALRRAADLIPGRGRGHRARLHCRRAVGPVGTDAGPPAARGRCAPPPRG